MSANWYYLSFSEEDGWIGGLYACAIDRRHALHRSFELEIDPGDSVMIIGPLPEDEMDENVPLEYRGRLLSKDELGDHYIVDR